MSYNPTNWSDGDLVTSAKLNKIEQGIADSGNVIVLEVNLSDEHPTIPMKFKDIVQCAQQNKLLFIKVTENNLIFYGQIVELNSYTKEIVILFGSDPLGFSAASDDDYPVMDTTT